MRPSSNLENITPLDTYWRVQLVWMKVYAHISLEPPLEYNQDQAPLMNQGSLWFFLTILVVSKILCIFRLDLEGETGKGIPESSRLDFVEKFVAKNFALSDTEDNTSGPLNEESITDLSSLRTLLAIRQKSREPSFWEVINSFVLITYASSAVSKILWQRLLAFPNFTLDLFYWQKQKKRISVKYGSNASSRKPWRRMRLDLILTMRDIYINSNMNPLAKFTISSRNINLKDIILWSIFQTSESASE